MMERNHPLTVGEVVYDANERHYGVLLCLENGKATLDVDAQPDDREKLPDGWCAYENYLTLDTEAPDGKRTWETENLDALYQVAWGIKDRDTDNIVVYEHNDPEGNGPYYSPYLNENLFDWEVYEI